MLNLSENFFYRDRKVPRVILENWESLAVWYVINWLKFMYKVMYESVSSYNYLYNSPEHEKAIVTIKRVRDIVCISGMEGEETETKLLNSIYIFSWEKIISVV